jgi:predicted DNA-binding protein
MARQTLKQIIDKKKEHSTQIGLWVPNEAYEALKALSDSSGIKIAAIVRLALEKQGFIPKAKSIDEKLKK